MNSWSVPHPEIAELFDRDEMYEVFLSWRGIENPCDKCGGAGVKQYTHDICEECWGTGDRNRKGVDLRKLFSELNELKRKQQCQK